MTRRRSLIPGQVLPGVPDVLSIGAGDGPPAIPAPAPQVSRQQPEPQFRSVEQAVAVPRPIPVAVGAHATTKTPLPHPPETRAERAVPDPFEFAAMEAAGGRVQAAEQPEFPVPVPVYVVESRNGDLMIRAFTTSIKVVPTGNAITLVPGSVRERSELRIVNEDATNAIRIGADAASVATTGFLIKAGVTPDPFPMQTAVYGIAIGGPVQVSILAVYEKVFQAGYHPHSNAERGRGAMAQIEQEAAEFMRRVEGWI